MKCICCGKEIRKVKCSGCGFDCSEDNYVTVFPLNKKEKKKIDDFISKNEQKEEIERYKVILEKRQAEIEAKLEWEKNFRQEEEEKKRQAEREAELKRREELDAIRQMELNEKRRRAAEEATKRVEEQRKAEEQPQARIERMVEEQPQSRIERIAKEAIQRSMSLDDFAKAFGIADTVNYNDTNRGGMETNQRVSQNNQSVPRELQRTKRRRRVRLLVVFLILCALGSAFGWWLHKEWKENSKEKDLHIEETENKDNINEWNESTEWSITSGDANGIGVLESSTGGRYEGELQNGLPNGEGKLTMSEGSVFEGEFLEGDFVDGIWKRIDDNGWTLEVEIIDGVDTGFVKIFAEGSLLEGKMIDGVLEFGKFTAADGSILEPEIIDGKATGFIVITRLDGTIYKITIEEMQETIQNVTTP